MRKTVFLLALVAALAVAFAVPGLALANFAIHGGYIQDTDSCAGCHRAHTSASSITWADSYQTEHSALLVSQATEMYQFCYACHDGTAQGANTDVQFGQYVADSTYSPQPDATHNVSGSTLNGGGFEKIGGVGGQSVTSTHMYNGASWGAYGGGLAGMGLAGADGDTIGQIGMSNQIKMDCTSCHDPHGSSNYRLLKDQVNGNAVGGYTGGGVNPTPTPWVTSVETGYPQGGWLLHEPGQVQMAAYKPNYTKPMYAKAPLSGGTPDPLKGMSGWCSGCHSTYIMKGQDGAVGPASIYNAGDGAGLVSRHRHPVNVQLSVFAGPQSLVVTDLPLPLGHSIAESGTPSNSDQDWIDCLSCHYAHGTTATMVGWAGNADSLGNPPFPNSETGNRASMLLRLNNRGVCEVCHNK
jgi:hypothetical protein